MTTIDNGVDNERWRRRVVVVNDDIGGGRWQQWSARERDRESARDGERRRGRKKEGFYNI